MASIKNCIKISAPLAPTAIRKPISLVRSFTETYIIFMMPIPPINKEILATATNNIVSISEVELNVEINSSIDFTVKSSA